jgi:hypothetical protein
MGARARWALLSAAAAVHLTFLVSLHTGWLNPLFNDAYNRPGPGVDLFAVYHAGRQVVTDRDPYLMDEEPRVTPHYSPFRYPPAVALTIGVAVSGLKPWPTYIAWLVVLELVLAANLLLMRKLVHDELHRDVLAAGFLAFTPLYLELWMGQFTLATATLVMFAFYAWERGRARLGAGLWAGAAAIKLFPLALVPLLLRRRRYLAVVVGGAVLGASLSWFLWHGDDWEIFYRLNFTEVDFRTYHAGNFGLQAWVYETLSLFHSPTEPQWRAIASLMSLALVAATTLAMVRHRDADARVSVAIALILLPLLSKHVWEHHYVLVLPALVLLTAAWADQPKRLRLLVVVYALLWLPSALVFLQSGAPTWYPELQWSQGAVAAYHALKPLTLLALFVYCVRAQLTP